MEVLSTGPLGRIPMQLLSCFFSYFVLKKKATIPKEKYVMKNKPPLLGLQSPFPLERQSLYTCMCINNTIDIMLPPPQPYKTTLLIFFICGISLFRLVRFLREAKNANLACLARQKNKNREIYFKIVLLSIICFI